MKILSGNYVLSVLLSARYWLICLLVC
jgi:hypothetical protein